MKKKIWCIRKNPAELVNNLSRELEISPILSNLLINRGIREPEQGWRFLNPSLRNLHNPFLMKDMDKATDRIIYALSNRERIAIYGDYDADGITGTALLYLFLRKLGADVDFYLSNRFEEGYGLSIEAIDTLFQKGVKLVITVDCGISCTEEVKFARDKGIDVIITDHHEIPPEIPKSFAIINPKQKDCLFPFKELAGVGVAFNLAIALRTKLRERGIISYEDGPNLREFLDLVAIGTFADIVPLKDENRIFTRFGLKELTRGNRAGIRALKELSGLQDVEINPYAVSYIIAPRINASGRVNSPFTSFELLVEEDYQRALEIASELERDNRQRMRIEEELLNEATEMIESDPESMARKSIVIAKEGWHIGVIGLIASRLVDLYSKPSVVISLSNGCGRGSARAPHGFSLIDALRRSSSYLLKFGGHDVACGFTISEKSIKDFRDRFEEIAEEYFSDQTAEDKLFVDMILDFSHIDLRLIDEIESLEPFGPGNSEPLFITRGVQLEAGRVVGDNHLRMFLRESGKVLGGIAFEMASLYPFGDDKVDIVFTPRRKQWNGETKIEIRLKDIIAHGKVDIFEEIT